ncbi:MAG: 6,7-dimethyl-8-ribityllumazine synthase [Magnetospirillum sp.]|nr:6,7-dimethyl-8-ribityllumazine synthase [Magnetospirillum sp.]
MRARVLIVEARFYDHIADGLLAGATAALEAAGVAVDRIVVPGIYEIPAALEMVLEAQRRGVPGRPAYDGFVTLGCAIRGESDHYDYICTQCMRGLNDLAVANHLALGNGVLTVHDEAQALARSEPARKNIGGLAARACLRMMDLKRELKL